MLLEVNKALLIWCFLVLGSFSLVIILYTWHLEAQEITSPSSLDYIVYSLYDILSFPLPDFYRELIQKNKLPPSVNIYFLSFILNNILYAFVTERIAKVIQLLKDKI